MNMSSLVDLKKEALASIKLFQNVKLAKKSRQAHEVAHQIAKFSFERRVFFVIVFHSAWQMLLGTIVITFY